MLNRWIGLVVISLMLAANATLFVQEILPDMMAGDPPLVGEGGLSHNRRVQIAIYNREDELIGRSWTLTDEQAHLLSMESSTMLFPILLPNGIQTPVVRIDTGFKYRLEDGLLDEMSMTMRGLPAGITVFGELVAIDAFVCKWQIGHLPQGRFVLDGEATRALGDVVRPFHRLPGLYVGRSWRLNLMDPLSRIFPSLGNESIMAEPILVRVTRTEVIEHRGRPLEVFVVESHRARAWVSPQGAVLRQEVEVPILGKLTLRDEPFDSEMYNIARRWSPGQDMELPR